MKTLLSTFAATLLLGLSAAFASSTAPISFYKAEGNGNDENSVNAANASQVSYATGKVGQAFSFNGSTGYVDFGTWFTFQSFTIGMWINDGGSQAGGAPIINEFDFGVPGGIALSCNARASSSTYDYTTNDGAPAITFSTTPGTWQYLAITRDGTSRVTNIYLDGQLIGTATGTGDLFGSPALVNGLRAGWGSDIASAHWKGLLDEMRFFDRALSAGEVASLAADYDAVRDFSATTNSASQVWQYGYTNADAPDGTGFTNYEETITDVTPNPNLIAWRRPAQASDMVVVFNTTGGDFTYNGGSSVQPADVLALYPGNDGRKSVVRWVAPESGTYTVQGRFQGIQHETSTDATIVKNGDTAHPLLFNAGDPVPAINYINGFGVQKPFSFSVDVNAGDTLDFRVGWGSNSQYSYDGTGLALSISKASGGGSPPTLTFSETGPTTPGGSIHFTATFQTAWNLRVQSLQSDTTPTDADEGSWTTLPDGRGGAMTEDSQNPGNYSLDSTFYPAGNNVYFRAIAAKTGQNDVKAVPLGPLTVQQAVIAISAALSSTADPVHGSVTHVGEDLTFKFFVTNSGHATARNLKVSMVVPTFIHEDVALTIKTVKGSNQVQVVDDGPDTSELAVGVPIAPTIASNFPPGIPTIVSIDDATHFTVSAAANNSGNMGALVQFGGTRYQFDAADVTTISSGGSYVSATPGNMDAQIVWDAGDHDGDTGSGPLSFTNAFTIHISDKVRELQGIAAIPDRYSVFSMSAQPPTSTNGFLSNVDVVASSIEGPIVFTCDPQNATVAPGGLFTYRFTLTNLTSKPVTSPRAVVVVPNGARFDTSYPTGRRTSVPGVGYVSGGKRAFKQVFVPGNPQPQVVIITRPLAAHGDRRGNDTVVFDVTFQAQWISPSDLPKISTINYGAAFLDPAKFIDPATGDKTSGTKQFADAYTSVNSSMDFHTATDFYALVTNTTHKLGVSTNESGIVDVALTGTLGANDGPNLTLVKAIGDDDSMALDDINFQDQGDGSLINTVEPGKEITFAIGVGNANDAGAAAEDVVVIDDLPVGTQLVTPGKNPSVLDANSSPKDLKSAVTIVLKPDAKPGKQSLSDLYVLFDGHSLRVGGFHIEPGDELAFTYTVRVTTTGNDAPAIGDVLHAFRANPYTSSSQHSFFGFPGDIPIKVVGPTQFSLSATAWNPSGATTSFLGAIANALNAIYAGKHLNDPPLMPAADANTPAQPIPGVQRYYLHYANTGPFAVSGVQLNAPLPANTVFYRGATLKNGRITSSTAADTTTVPGTARFDLGKLKAAEDGDVMLEVIVLDGALQIDGSYAKLENAKIQSTVAARARDASGEVTASAVSTPVSGQQLGFMITAPLKVNPGDQFQVKLAIFNYGDTALETPYVSYFLPTNATVVNFEYGLGAIAHFAEDDPSREFDMSDNNGSLGANYPTSWTLGAHQSAIVTVILQATGAAGSVISHDASAGARYVGAVQTGAIETEIVAPNPLQSLTPAFHTTVSSGPHFLNLPGGQVIVSLGGGNVVAAGAGNLLTSDGAGVVSQGGGNIVAAGGGNAIGVSGLASLGITNAAGILADIPKVVSQGGGNLWNGGSSPLLTSDGAGLLTSDGAGIISHDGGTLHIVPIAAVVSQGGGNVVSQGGGNVVSQGGGNVVAAGGGNIVASGGGNAISNNGSGLAGSILTYGGGVVSQGGGNLVGVGAAGLVGAKGAQIAITPTASSALVNTNGGNVVSAGGGNAISNNGSSALPDRTKR